MHFAVTSGSAEFVEMILKLIETNVLKLDVNAVDANKNTALKKIASRYLGREREPKSWGHWGWGWKWTWKTDASYQCMKVMLDYRERLGIDVNKEGIFTE